MPVVRRGKVVEEDKGRHVRGKGREWIREEGDGSARGAVDYGKYRLGRGDQSDGGNLRLDCIRRGPLCADKPDAVDAYACRMQRQVDEDGIPSGKVLWTAHAVRQCHEQDRKAVVEILLALPELALLQTCRNIIGRILGEAVLQTRVEHVRCEDPAGER